MNAPRHGRSRILTIALVASITVHLAAVPFVRRPAIARAAIPQGPFRLDPAPAKPTPPPLRPTPPPKLVRPPVLPPPHAPRIARVVPPRSRSVAAFVGLATHRGNVPYVAPVSGTTDVGSGIVGGRSDAGSVGVAPSDPAPIVTSAPVAPVETPACSGAARDARVIDAVTPERPEIVAQQGASGHVEVRVDLSATGAVARAAVFVSSGNASLDAAALGAARQATYAAAYDGCKPITGSYLYTVDFEN